MKLADYGDEGFDQTIVTYIANRLAALGATEEAALFTRRDDSLGEAAIVTDLGIFIGKYAELSEPDPIGRKDVFELSLTSWPEVTMPGIVFARFVSSPDPSEIVTLRIREPAFRFTTTSSSDGAKAASEFHTAAMRHWRPPVSLGNG